MKLKAEHLLLVIVAFLVFTAALPTEVTFSSDGDLESENEHCLQPEEDGESAKTTVTVFHQDEFGNDLLPACIISIETPGTLYIATNENEALPEYDWMRTVGHAVGFHQAIDTEVIFIYRRRPQVSIFAHQRHAHPGTVVHYTVIITNEAAGPVLDNYTLRVHFDLRFSSVFRLEFMLDYLEVGDTVIEFSMPVIQSALAGVKNVKAILIHPPGMMRIDDTEVLTQVTVTHEEAQRPAPHPPVPAPPPSGQAPPSEAAPGQAPPASAPPSGTPPPGSPPSQQPPTSGLPSPSTPPQGGQTPPQASVPSPDESESSTDDENIYDDQTYDEEDVYGDESEEDVYHDPPENEVTDDGDDHYNMEDNDLVEDVDPKEDEETEKEKEPTLSMVGTLVYDVFILGAILGVNVKNGYKLTAIRF